jgi:hypothetical protein
VVGQHLPRRRLLRRPRLLFGLHGLPDTPYRLRIDPAFRLPAPAATDTDVMAVAEAGIHCPAARLMTKPRLAVAPNAPFILLVVSA